MSLTRLFLGLSTLLFLNLQATESFAKRPSVEESSTQRSFSRILPHPTLEISNSLDIHPPFGGSLIGNKQDREPCRTPVLSQLTRHRVASGETLDAIAQQYGLLPATLMGFNPSLQNGSVSPGREIVVPPFNGIRINVRPGTTWQNLAEQYNVRADVLFEINGCQPPANTVFIPGVNWSPTVSGSQTSPSSRPANSLNGYPLETIAEVIQDYGWQLQSDSRDVAFQSGVRLAAPVGSSVLAVGDGVVAFAGEQGNYGNLVVINHSLGLQTRYANLGQISVRVGQRVRSGAVIGKSGQVGSDIPPSLYFEVRSNSALGWIAQDPANYVENMRRFER